MPSLSLGLVAEGNAGTGVDHGGLLDDETILGKTGDVAAAVGQRDLVDLVGVEPDLALTALEDVGREALLELERHLFFGRGMGRKENRMELDNKSDSTTRTTAGTACLPPDEKEKPARHVSASSEIRWTPPHCRHLRPDRFVPSTITCR